MAALLRTPKFQVWSSSCAVDRRSGSCVSGTAASVSVGGGRRVLVSDVGKVAVLQYTVSLDEQSLGKLDAELNLPKAPRPFKLDNTIALSNCDEVYPDSLCRAALFARIVSLMQSRAGVRSEVVQCMVRMLNSGVVPNFTSVNAAGLELVAAITGTGGYCQTKKSIQPSESAFSAAGISPVKLFEEEAETLLKGHFLTTGAACLVASGAVNISSTVDCIASLTCDSFGAYMEPFESNNFDVSRPHRGQMASATNLRLLLEGSKRTNTPPSDATAFALRTFSSIPQVNGPASETIQAAVKYVFLLYCMHLSASIQASQT
jgi:histidine ammonia-lyase